MSNKGNHYKKNFPCSYFEWKYCCDHVRLGYKRSEKKFSKRLQRRLAKKEIKEYES